MIKIVILFSLGLICLIKGGDWFVDGAIGIARKFNIPEIIIGATIVSIGTTLPEVMVSSQAAMTGHSEIAYGNAIGSIICNTALISAITISLRPGKINKKDLYLPATFFLIAALFFFYTSIIYSYFTRVTGIILLGLFFLYILLNIYQVYKDESIGKTQVTQIEGKLSVDIGLLIVGAVVIAIGADLLVDNGSELAALIGVPESVIGLTLIALGTSLPELITAITALLKGHTNLSIGNIIGANLFNLVLVLGTSVTISPFAVPANGSIFGYNTSNIIDIPLMFLVMGILVIPAIIKGKLYRFQGILLLIIYLIYCSYLFIAA